MRPPFPGMDPYLEHPALWPDVHNRLIAAISDAIAPRVAPRYYVALESRAYLMDRGDVVLVGRPDVAVVHRPPPRAAAPAGSTAEAGGVAVLDDVEVPMVDELRETYLEVRDAGAGAIVTAIEILSPANKVHSEGRRHYEGKRLQIFEGRTSLVEIDLLRGGEPMAIVGAGAAARRDYRILVSRGWRRPKATLYAFDVRAPIPSFPLPLLAGDEEPSVDLNAILHALYDRARYDLRIDYAKPPAPPLSEGDAAWARGLIGG